MVLYPDQNEPTSRGGHVAVAAVSTMHGRVLRYLCVCFPGARCVQLVLRRAVKRGREQCSRFMLRGESVGAAEPSWIHLLQCARQLVPPISCRPVNSCEFIVLAGCMPSDHARCAVCGVRAHPVRRCRGYVRCRGCGDVAVMWQRVNRDLCFFAMHRSVFYTLPLHQCLLPPRGRNSAVRFFIWVSCSCESTILHNLLRAGLCESVTCMQVDRAEVVQ